MKIRNVAIVGSNGFIATHLVNKLKKMPEVRISLFGRSDTKIREDKLPYKKADLHDKKKLAEDFAEIDLVYYLASETIPSTSWENPGIEVEKNLLPFLNFLDVVSKLKVKKIVFVSSAGTIYGATSGKVKEHSEKKPFSPYGIMKLAMENFLHHYQVKCGLQYDIYRVSNVYGEGQNTGKGLGIINTFLEKILKENRVRIFGDGSSTRNYIYVKDVAELLSFCLLHPETSSVFNISSNTTLSINELVTLLQKNVEEKFEVLYENSRQSDNSYIDLDNSALLQKFPDFVFTDINEGIKKTYTSLKSTVNVK